MLTAICIVSGKISNIFFWKACLLWLQFRRAGRFGTKGLAITFVSSESDQTVMSQIQARFEVAVPELPEKIDSSTYSMFSHKSFASRTLNAGFNSDLLKSV